MPLCTVCLAFLGTLRASLFIPVINRLINYEGVCRMALSAPGLSSGRYCPKPLCIVHLVPRTVYRQWCEVEVHWVLASANKFCYQVSGRWGARSGADDVAPDVELSLSPVSIASLSWRSSSNSSRLCEVECVSAHRDVLLYSGVTLICLLFSYLP